MRPTSLKEGDAYIFDRDPELFRRVILPCYEYGFWQWKDELSPHMVYSELLYWGLAPIGPPQAGQDLENPNIMHIWKLVECLDSGSKVRLADEDTLRVCKFYSHQLQSTALLRGKIVHFSLHKGTFHEKRDGDKRTEFVLHTKDERLVLPPAHRSQGIRYLHEIYENEDDDTETWGERVAMERDEATCKWSASFTAPDGQTYAVTVKASAVESSDVPVYHAFLTVTNRRKQLVWPAAGNVTVDEVGGENLAILEFSKAGCKYRAARKAELRLVAHHPPHCDATKRG